MKKILIADADSASRTYLSKVVEKLGYTGIKCSNGALAWEVLNENQDINLIITDYQMPKISGATLLKKIRESRNLKSLPIIMLSSTIGLESFKDILELGNSRFIAKPIYREDLEKKIKKMIG